MSMGNTPETSAEDRTPEDVDPGLMLLGRKVRLLDIFHFVERTFGADPACVACGKGIYIPSLYSPAHNQVTVVTSVTLGEEEPHKLTLTDDLFMPVFYLGCNYCGHVRMHTIWKVVEWLNARDQENLDGHS